MLPDAHPSAPEGDIEECLRCHSQSGQADHFEWLVHFRHFGTEEFTSDCWSCHHIGSNGKFCLIEAEEKKGINITRRMAEKMVPYFRSWAESEFMDHRHAKKKISCNSCHETFLPRRRVSQEKCLKCHKSYQHLSKLSKTAEYNPHNSHLGEIRCTLCHKSHERFVLYCNRCHTSDPRFACLPSKEDLKQAPDRSSSSIRSGIEHI